MGGDRLGVFVLGAFVLGIFGFAFSIVGFSLPMTGYAIFGDSNFSDFAGGVFSNTEWNGSAVVLFGDNLSGSFESRIFDSGIVAGATWNNISWVQGGNYGSELEDNQQVSLMSGNVLLMHMNEVSGAIMDSSGNGNNGTQSGGVTYGVNGKLNTGIGFDGVDDNIAFPRMDADVLTIGAWIKRDVTGSDHTIVGYGSALIYYGYGFYVTNDNYLRFVAVDSVGSVNFDVPGSTTTINADTWYYVSAVLEGVGDGDDAIIYVNGVEEARSDQEKSLILGPILPKVGQWGEAQLQYRFNGVIDELAIWDRNLSSDEISEIYQKGVARLNLTARSCDDDACSGESFTDITMTSSPQDLSLDNNTYFQYKFYFETDDSSYSPLIESVDVDYTVLNVAPVVGIVSPVEGTNYNYNESLALNFSVSDADGNLDSCWYNLNDGANVSLVSCSNVTFDIGDGVYVLNVYANDSFGLEVVDSVNFNVDVNGVDAQLFEPIGEKGSRTGIGIEYFAAGAVKCWYNVETSIGGSVIGNTSLDCVNSSEFDVSTDGDYVFNLFANNSMGSFAFASSTFSVDSSEDVPVSNGGSSGGGSSGGGSTGGGSSFVSSANLEIEPISVIATLGEERSLLASVKNKGRVAANKCVLEGGDYVDSDSISNIGVGEIVEFAFVLSILDFDVENLSLNVVCLEGVAGEVPLEVLVLRPTLDVSVEEISFGSDGGLLTRYNIDPAYNSDYVLSFKVFDSDGNVVAEIYEEVGVVAGEIYEGEVSFDITGVSEGMLRVTVSSEDVSLVEEDFIYYGPSGITGFAFLNAEGSGSYVWGVIIFGLLVLLGWRVWKLYKK